MLILRHLHLILIFLGVDKGGIHLFGTDKSGKDIYSRTMVAIFTSLKCGVVGVFIAFVLALVIGGISGYYGGWIDQFLQMITDAIRTIPQIPLFMALAAFLPQEWSCRSSILRYCYHPWIYWMAHTR